MLILLFFLLEQLRQRRENATTFKGDTLVSKCPLGERIKCACDAVVIRKIDTFDGQQRLGCIEEAIVACER